MIGTVAVALSSDAVSVASAVAAVQVVSRWPSLALGVPDAGLKLPEPAVAYPLASLGTLIVGLYLFLGVDSYGPYPILLLIYGFFVPKYWYLLPLATSWIMFLNMFLDMAQYPTSHNLFPFEVMIYAVCNLPAAAAAGLASWMGRRYQSRKTSEVTP